MKTLEVLERVLKGKRVASTTQVNYRDTLTSLAGVSEEWPDKGVVINEWLGGLSGYADISIRMKFDVVNSAGKYMKRAYGLENPCDTAERPKVSKKRRRYFTPDEMMRVIKACTNEFERALIFTLVDSTCRIGELVNLKGRDVGDSWINVEGKTGQRRYRLDSSICVGLRKMAGDGEACVFRGRTDEGYTYAGALGKRVRDVMKRSGLTGAKLGPHTLRHSGASLVAIETGSALAVKALLQHDDIETSMVYIHDAEDVIQQRVSPLRILSDKVMAGGKMLALPVGGGGTVDGEFAEVVPDAVDTLLTGEMGEIPDGVSVRPLLKTEDLRLVRKVFVDYVGRGGDGSMEAVRLLKRMLRKV